MKKNIRLNGKPQLVVASNLEELVAELELRARTFAIELNKVIVPKSSYQSSLVTEGDEIEIVHCVAGG